MVVVVPVLGRKGGPVRVWFVGVMGVADVRVVLGEANTAVLVTLVIILKVTCLLPISEPEADPTEVYCFLPPIPDSSRWKRRENIF